MAIRVPSNPRQSWLARIGIGLTILIAVVLSQIGRLDPVHRTVQGQTTTFTSKWWLSLVFLLPTIPMVLLGIVLWMQPRRLYKFMSVVVIAMAVLLIGNLVPTSFLHRAVLTPDGFELRTGAWYAPRSYSIHFDDVRSADIEEDTTSRSERSRHYVLACYLKTPGPEDPVLLPINDMVKRALRQIVESLKARGAILEDPDDGPFIPPDLADSLR